MKKAKSILKKWLEFADGIGLDFKQAQQMAVEHCNQNNDHKNAMRIAKLEVNDVWEGNESNIIYQIIVGLRKGIIQPYAPKFDLEHDVTEFTHDEPCSSIDDETCTAQWSYNEDTKEFDLVAFNVTCPDYTETATNAQIDALSELLIEPKREEFSETPEQDWYLDTI